MTEKNEVVIYKDLKEVRSVECAKWKKMKVDVLHVVNEKFGVDRCEIRFNLPYLQIKDTITNAKFNSILISLRKVENANLKGMDIPYRIIRGKTIDGKEFSQVQLKFGDYCGYTHILRSAEIRNLEDGAKLTGKTIEFVEKPDGIAESFDVDDVQVN